MSIHASEERRLCSAICLEKARVGRNGKSVSPIVLFQNQTAAKNPRGEKKKRALFRKIIEGEGEQAQSVGQSYIVTKKVRDSSQIKFYVR